MALEDSLKYDKLTLAKGPAFRPVSHKPIYIRPKDAEKYLKEKYGFGSQKSLAKLACRGGGPEFRKAGRMRLYKPAALDAWALSKIGPPVHSTSEYPQNNAPNHVGAAVAEREGVSGRDRQSDEPRKRGRPAGAKPTSATLDRVEAAEAKRKAV
jgi:hypothetical protein